MVFAILVGQPFVHMLEVAKQDFFRSAAPTFPKTPKIKDEKIKTLAHEVFGKFPPAFDAPRIPFDVKNNALAIGHPEVEGIDHAAVFHVKINLCKWKWILVREGFGQAFGTKKEEVLSEVEHETKPNIQGDRPEK